MAVKRGVDLREGRKALFCPAVAVPRNRTIRPATWEERRAISAMAKTSPYTLHHHQSRVDFDEQRIAVCMEGDGSLSGFIRLRHGRTWSEILSIGVTQPRTGVVTALLRWAWMSSAHQLYYVSVQPENLEARAFFSAMGFRAQNELTMTCRRDRAARKGLAS